MRTKMCMPGGTSGPLTRVCLSRDDLDEGRAREIFELGLRFGASGGLVHGHGVRASSLRVYVCMYVCMCVCMYSHIMCYVRMYVCMFVCVYSRKPDVERESTGGLLFFGHSNKANLFT